MKNLNHLRIEAGYSIADLAIMMGVDIDVACRWLCGSVLPGSAEIDRLAHIFDVDPQTLVSIPSKPPGRGDKLRVKITTASGRFLGGDPSHSKRARPL